MDMKHTMQLLLQAHFRSINPELAKESMEAVLHNTPDLDKYTKIKISKIMDSSTSVLLSTFRLMDKYTNKSEKH